MIKHKKAMTIIALLSIILCICAAILVYCFQRQNDKYIKSAEEGDISRCQWMEMLCGQSGLTEYKNAAPYYEDVDAGSPYFAYIQSAVEWDVLSGDKTFEGDGYASGRFVALTAMKTLGERKLMTYLETEDAISDDTYVKLAMEHGLIEKDRLAEGISREECERILENLRSFYFDEFWRDDYSNAVYQDGVVELSPDEVLKSNADGSEIVVSGSALGGLAAGTVIVFEEKNTKCKLAREIIKADTDGTLALKPVELEQAVKSFTESDIMEVTFADIVNGYASAESSYSLIQPGVGQGDEVFMDMGFFSGEIRSKGYQITCSTEEEDDEKHLEVKITDHATGESLTIPIGDEVKLKGDYSAELDIKKILIGTQAQVDYIFMKGGLQYAEVAVDVESTFKGEIKAEEEKSIPLFKTMIPIAGGVVAVNLQFSLVLSIDGTVSLEAELPVGVTATYEKDKGFRYQRYEEKTGNPKIEANCDAGVKARIEPILAVLGCNIMDVEADAGMTASAKITRHPNSQICAQTAIAFPVIDLSVCGDDDTETVLGGLGLSKEWEIITAENAPWRKSLHYEVLPDQRTQFVDACTYQETEEDGEGEAAEDTEKPEDNSLHTYYMQNSDTKFVFDYPDGWSIDTEEIELMSEGFKEVVVLKKDNGVCLRYWEQKDNYPLGGNGHDMVGVEVTEAGNSLLEGFIVGKIKDISFVYYPEGEEEMVEDGSEMYAVIPKDYVGKNYYMGAYYADDLSFPYHGSTYYFAATGGATEEDKKEIIAILSSFREAP